MALHLVEYICGNKFIPDEDEDARGARIRGGHGAEGENLGPGTSLDRLWAPACYGRRPQGRFYLPRERNRPRRSASNHMWANFFFLIYYSMFFSSFIESNWNFGELFVAHAPQRRDNNLTSVINNFTVFNWIIKRKKKKKTPFLNPRIKFLTNSLIWKRIIFFFSIVINNPFVLWKFISMKLNYETEKNSTFE